MIRKLILAAALAAAFAGRAQAQDAAVARLVEEAAAVSPELAEARALLEAERARIPQAGAPADPTLSLGIQNDGFQKIQIGTMETSFYSIALTQPLYWPGKRGLREDVATLEARRAEARLARARLDLEGRVRRAWVGLLLVRGQLELIQDQERLWSQAEQAARTRYESGQVPQSDLLRAQLERARLDQRKWALEAEATNRAAELNRLRARPLDEPVPTSVRLAELPDPAVLAETEAQKDAETRSPEVHLAAVAIEQAARRGELARKERFPDFSVTAGLMPRGSLDPMWQLGLSVNLPIYAGRKQNRAVDEAEQRRLGEAQAAEAVRQVLRLRTRERVSALAALNRTNQDYRRRILVLSAASARSTLAQYEVARVPFAAVLDALSGYVSDRAGHLASVAEAQLVAIAQREVSLDAVPSMAGGPAAVAMPGTSATTARSSASASRNPPAGAEQSPSRGMSGM